MVAKAVLCAAALLLLPVLAPAQARCKDDLKDLRPRIDHMKAVSIGRYELASIWWNRAMAAEPGSESQCFNLLAKARKALTEPLPEVNNCTGPNHYLPECQNGGLAYGGGGAGPAGPLTGGGAGGGGGGGPVTPVGPGTAPPSFSSPGSVGQGAPPTSKN